MKQRLFNGFMRITGNKFISTCLSNIGYVFFVIYYYLKKLFARKTKTVTAEEARAILNDYSKKPEMDYTVTNKETTLDLSIIVPAYNAEKTITDCIDSVLKQTTKWNYELIVVNDGSTDKTKEYLDEYNNERLVVVNQENRGFSGARNRGIDESRGSHIMFLDSDDYLVGDCIESMMNRLKEEDADIIQGSYQYFTDRHMNEERLTNRVSTDPAVIVKRQGFPWAKIYKRELFNEIRYPLDTWFEDTITNFLIFRLCKKIIVTDEIVYAWRQNPMGITRNASKNKKSIDTYWVMEHIFERSKELNIPNDTVQYELYRKQMSSKTMSRIASRPQEVIESVFVLTCDMLDKVRPEGYKCKGSSMENDIEKAFESRNYKLWKLASSVA